MSDQSEIAKKMLAAAQKAATKFAQEKSFEDKLTEIVREHQESEKKKATSRALPMETVQIDFDDFKVNLNLEIKVKLEPK